MYAGDWSMLTGFNPALGTIMPPPLRYALDPMFQPRGDLAGPDLQRIRQALAVAVAKAPPVDPAALLPAEAVWLLSAVGRSLTGDPPRWGAVMALVDSAPEPLRDRLPLRLLWLRAAGPLGRQAEIIPEMTRLLSLEPVDDKRDAALVKMAVRMGLAHRLPALPRLYPLRWGAPQEKLAAALATLDPGPARATLPAALLGYLCQLRGIAQEEVEDFADRLARSRTLREFLTYLGTAVARIVNGGGRAETATEAKVLALAAEFTAGIAAWDFSLLERLRDQGRSILLLGSHLGTVEPRGGDLRRLQMRIALIRGGVPLNDHLHALKDVPGAIVINTANAPSMPFEFMKLAKKLRTEPFLIRIFPDGAQGRSVREIDLDGCRIKIGTGAALLGYHAKAQVVFGRSRWTGQSWAFDPQLGPDLARAGSLEEADALIAEFYAECLLAMLRGPAEDIGGVSGAIAPSVR